MTLSVRFSPDLQGKLTKYCETTGTTKSMVLQEAVLEYLVRRDTGSSAASPASAPVVRESSKAYRAFQRAGLIGALRDDVPAYISAGDLHQGAAKQAVRRTAMAAMARRKAARG